MEKETKIRRAKHDKEHPFVMISKQMIRDKCLSLKSRACLTYLLSYPDDWITHPQKLAEDLGIGRDQTYAILKELIANGYCRRVEEKDENKRFLTYYYEFSELKEFLPLPEKPDPGKPDPGNPHLTNKENTYKDKKDITPSADASEIVLFFHKNILKIKPDFLEPNLQIWTRHVDRMLKLDKRDPEKIKAVISWLPTHPFWCDKILSPEKLRKQFDQLELAMREKKTIHVTNHKEKLEKMGFTNYSEHNNYLVFLDDISVGLQPKLGNSSVISIKLREHGFWEQFKNECYKRDIKFEEVP